MVNVAVLFRESAVINLHQTRGRLVVSFLPDVVGCGAANGYLVEIRGRNASRTVRRATAMAIIDALHRHDQSVSWLTTREAAGDVYYHYDDVAAKGRDCTRRQLEIFCQRRWTRCCAGSSWITKAETNRLSEMREAPASSFRWSRRVGMTSNVLYDRSSGCCCSCITTLYPRLSN